MSIKLHRSLTWTETIDARYPKTRAPLLVTAFATLGVIYGDIGTSPLYVMNGIFPTDGGAPSQEDIIGAISAIIWTLTLVPLLKYSLIALEFGTGDGEGGPFALFSQLYPKEKPGHELTMPSIHSQGTGSTAPTSFMARKWVKVPVQAITLFAVALIMSDGILTPSVSVVSAVGGLAVAVPSVSGSTVGIAIAILVLLFIAQAWGTAKLAFTFAPVVFTWLGLLGGAGIANITHHPGIFRAFDPSRAVMFFVRRESIEPLTGVLLAITGVEALFACLGQFSKTAIRITFSFYAYPCLVLAYLGQGARLITDGETVITNVFYESIPGGKGSVLWWIVWIFGIFATVVASQAMITASFSLIQQMTALGSFPPVRIIHTSDTHIGQIYAPVINFLLLVGCIGVTGGFGTNTGLTNAYGFAVSGVLFMTTFLLTLVMLNVRHLPWIICGVFFVVAGFVDTLFFAASTEKVVHGAWFTLSLAVVIGLFLFFWTWSKGLEDAFDATHRMRLSQLLSRASDFDSTDEKGSVASGIGAVRTVVEGDVIDEVAMHEVPRGSGSSDSQAGGPKIKLLDAQPQYTGDLVLRAANGSDIPLPRLETFNFFHHLGSGFGAPHSFTALIRHQPALPRVIVFLSIRVVGVPYLVEEDKFLIDKLRSLEGFYVMTLRLGYRDEIDLRGLGQPVLQRIIALERGSKLPGEDAALDAKIAAIQKAAQTCQHILPSYHVTSAGTTYSTPLLKRCADLIRTFLLEEVYRRVSQNFPVTSAYAVDESTVLRIGVNAAI